jgi:2-polyprenyl-6-methoxyphenol hydroxylase-like FAD-dependent oxidoreductase
MHGIVIGGGIGGMALAAALERVGISCDVYEQAKELREVGAGLALWSNALIALERLDAATRVMTLGSKVERFEIRTPNGRVRAVTPLARAAKRFGVPGSVCLHRADLLSELARRVASDRVQLDARCIEVREDSGTVFARFANRREASGDFLVGADGIRSVVREQLFGKSALRYAGYTCWRGVAKREQVALAPGTAFETWGQGRRFSVHPCGLGRVFWWQLTTNLPTARTARAVVKQMWRSFSRRGTNRSLR